MQLNLIRLKRNQKFKNCGQTKLWFSCYCCRFFKWEKIACCSINSSFFFSFKNFWEVFFRHILTYHCWTAQNTNNHQKKTHYNLELIQKEQPQLGIWVLNHRNYIQQILIVIINCWPFVQQKFGVRWFLCMCLILKRNRFNFILCFVVNEWKRVD